MISEETIDMAKNQVCTTCGVAGCPNYDAKDKVHCEDWRAPMFETEETKAAPNVYTTNLFTVIEYGMQIHENIKHLERELIRMRDGRHSAWEKDIRQDDRYAVQLLYTELVELRRRLKMLQHVAIQLNDISWETLTKGIQLKEVK